MCMEVLDGKRVEPLSTHEEKYKMRGCSQNKDFMAFEPRRRGRKVQGLQATVASETGFPFVRGCQNFYLDLSE
jgi:hypothetical protein